MPGADICPGPVQYRFMPLSELIRSSTVVLITIAAFLSGAFRQPLWIPIALAPIALWGYAPLARQVLQADRVGFRQWSLVSIAEIANLYAVFGFGWLLTSNFGTALLAVLS